MLRQLIRNLLLALFIAFVVVGCLTISGTYRVEAVDANGIDLGEFNVAAQGGEIYIVRNAFCSEYPDATVYIYGFETGYELRSESPYKCKK